MSMFEMANWGMYNSQFKAADERYVVLSLCLMNIGSNEINEKVISLVMEVTGFSRKRVVKILSKVFPYYVFERGRLVSIDVNNPKPKTIGQIVRSKLSKSKKDSIKNESGGRCYWCRQDVDYLEIDHVIPVSRGGTNERENLVASCKVCNADKGSKLIHEWIKP